jgi:hypothetical protein
VRILIIAVIFFQCISLDAYKSDMPWPADLISRKRFVSSVNQLADGRVILSCKFFEETRDKDGKEEMHNLLTLNQEYQSAWHVIEDYFILKPERDLNNWARKGSAAALGLFFGGAAGYGIYTLLKERNSSSLFLLTSLGSLAVSYVCYKGVKALGDYADTPFVEKRSISMFFTLYGERFNSLDEGIQNIYNHWRFLKMAGHDAHLDFAIDHITYRLNENGWSPYEIKYEWGQRVYVHHMYPKELIVAVKKAVYKHFPEKYEEQLL